MNHAPRLFRWLGAALLLGQLNCPVFALFPKCGDGILDEVLDEKCDDGNKDSGDGCSAACVIELCGDGEINNAPNGETTETCDDGNNINNDKCSAACEVEKCGDGIQSANEECDDRNNAPGDGCDAQCLFEVPGNCQDDKLNPDEECDDGNNINNDGCQRNCTLTPCDPPTAPGSFQFGSVCYDALLANASNIAPSFFALGDFKDDDDNLRELALLVGNQIEFLELDGNELKPLGSDNAPNRAVSFMNAVNLDDSETDDLAFSFNNTTPGLEVRLNAAEEDPTFLNVNPNKTSRSFVSGDANGDGNDDIISVVELQDVGIQRYIKQGNSLNEDGGFFSGVAAPAPTALGQLDGTGGPDYLLVSEGAAPGTGRIAFTPLDDNGNAAASTSFIVDGVDGFIFAVAGDLIQGNGADEVAVLNNLDESVSVIAKNSTNVLQNTNQVRLTGKPRSAVFLDANRDGRLDLVVLGENFFAILPSNGQGVLQAPLHIAFPDDTTPVGLAIGKVDPRNNLPDIAIALSSATGTDLLILRSR